MLLMGCIPNSIPQSQLPCRTDGSQPHMQQEQHHRRDKIHGRMRCDEYRC